MAVQAGPRVQGPTATRDPRRQSLTSLAPTLPLQTYFHLPDTAGRVSLGLESSRAPYVCLKPHESIRGAFPAASGLETLSQGLGMILRVTPALSNSSPFVLKGLHFLTVEQKTLCSRGYLDRL